MPFQIIETTVKTTRLDPQKVEMSVTRLTRVTYLKLTVGGGVAKRLGLEEHMLAQVAEGTGPDAGRYQIVFGRAPLPHGRNIRVTKRGLVSFSLGAVPPEWPDGVLRDLCCFSVKSTARSPEGPMLVVELPARVNSE